MFEANRNLPREQEDQQKDRVRLVFEHPIDVRSVSLTVLMIVAVVYILYFAKALFLPIALAFLLSFLLGPLVRLLKGVGLPESLGAALVLIFLLGVFAYGAFRLTGPASQWMQRLPEGAQKLEQQLQILRGPMAEVSKAAKEVEDTLDGEEDAPEVEIKTPSLTDSIFNQTPYFFVGLSATLILLYFLLAFGDLFLRKLVKLMPTFKDKRSAVEIIRGIEDHISYYLFTVTLINIGLGLSIALALYLLGMPNPLLWGTLAAILNFIPYLGAITGGLLVLVVAAITFESVELVLLAPGIYLSLTSLEGSFITPLILGQRLTLNPIVIFVSLIFWGWLWGIAGALIAVPMLVCFKILCDHIEPLESVGDFLGW